MAADTLSKVPTCKFGIGPRPRELCERIAAGAVECLMSMHETKSEAAAEASADAEPGVCPACKGHMRKTDPRHTRDSNCKFPDVESVPWTWPCFRKNCKFPGRVNRKNCAHPSHRNDDACQWVVARTMPEGAARPVPIPQQACDWKGEVREFQVHPKHHQLVLRF